MVTQTNPPQTLSVDIGGSGIKVMLLDENGNPTSDRDRVETPQPALPDLVLTAIVTLAQGKTFDRVSVGFPGVIKSGVTMTAANLNPSWIGFDLASALAQHLQKPVRVINDADMQGLGSYRVRG